MAQLNDAHPNPKRASIVVADLIGAREGDNPHIWYLPATMGKYAMKLTDLLIARDPQHADEYGKRLADFLSALKQLIDRIESLTNKVSGTDVIATEPVFGYMAVQLHFKMHAMDFQNHVMNNVEPTAQETEEFENLLKQHEVKILFYNGQASDPIADRMKDIATTAGVPVVGVTETEPANTTYVSWMLAQLDEVEKALAK
jgi:zinc/manganese transport system substrate-binding protein